MKRVKNLFYLLVVMLIGIPIVDAASISVTSNTTSMKVGNTVKVTVSVGESDDADGWEYCLDYDSSKFSLIDPASPCVKGSLLGGFRTVVFSLKSISSGTSVVTVKNYDVIDYKADSSSVNKGSVSITAKTQQEIEASYSDNANLTSLRVENYDITPSFDKDKTEYNLEVGNDVSSINIKAAKADSNASVSGIGTKSLTEGMNSFKVVVTAQKGNKKTYVVNVIRKELNPIKVTINGGSYTVVRKNEESKVPAYYSATTVNINNEDIPGYKSDITGYTLVELKNEVGEIGLYSYSNGTYKTYKQVDNEGFVFIPEETNETIDDYKNKKTIKIKNVDVEVYEKEKGNGFVLVYGMNASTGKKSWYKYDTEEETFQRYVSDKVEVEGNKTFGGSGDGSMFLTIIFAAGLGIAIVVIIIQYIMSAKKDKKIKKLIEIIEKKLKTKRTVKEKEPTDDKKEDKKDSKKDEPNDEEFKGTMTIELERLNDQFLAFVDSPRKGDIKKKASNSKEEVKEEPEKEEPKVEEVNKVQEEKDENISKREIRKMEKELKKKEELEAAALREDFLDTKENTFLGDTDIIEEVKAVENSASEERAAAPKKKRKKKKN